MVRRAACGYFGLGRLLMHACIAHHCHAHGIAVHHSDTHSDHAWDTFTALDNGALYTPRPIPSPDTALQQPIVLSGDQYRVSNGAVEEEVKAKVRFLSYYCGGSAHVSVRRWATIPCYSSSRIVLFCTRTVVLIVRLYVPHRYPTAHNTLGQPSKPRRIGSRI